MGGERRRGRGGFSARFCELLTAATFTCSSMYLCAHISGRASSSSSSSSLSALERLKLNSGRFVVENELQRHS